MSLDLGTRRGSWLSGRDGSARVPGLRRQAEWTRRRSEPLGRAVLEALAPRLIERLVEATEIADAVRERVPEVIEVRIVGTGVDLAELDPLKPSGAPALLELMRARERVGLVGPERTGELRVDVEGGIPDRPQERHAPLEVPDARRDCAAWPRNTPHLRRTAAGVVHAVHDELREHGVELGVAPGKLLPDPHTQIGTGCTVAASRDEALGGIDRSHVPRPENLRQHDRHRARPAAHVQRPLARPDAGHPDHFPCEVGTVTADVSVVGVYRGTGDGGPQRSSHVQLLPAPELSRRPAPQQLTGSGSSPTSRNGAGSSPSPQ